MTELIPDYLPWNPDNASDQRIRLSDPQVSLTGAELDERVAGAAEHLADLGVHRGSVVAAVLPNQAELVIALYAAWRLGAAFTPVNPTFTAAETRHQIENSEASVVIASDALAAENPASLPSQRFGTAVVVPVTDLRRAPILPDQVTSPTPVPGDTAMLVYTSGSTGRPKGVQLTHANLDAMSAAQNEVVHMNRDTHALLALPLFHVNALLASIIAPFRAGGRTTVMERFDPVAFARAVTELRPTYFSAVPAIYAYLLNLPEELPDGTVPDFSSLDYAICGAAPASIDMLLAFEQRFGTRVITGYGLTEGTCVSTVMRPEDEPRAGSVGRALPGQEVRIDDGAGGAAPAGVPGEVLIRGANVMAGYLGRAEETAATVVDGWLHTGDVGVLDDEGYLTLVDRLKDIIIRGGENLYPSEIEAALCTHPAVSEAAVVGRPHDILTEIPVAYVTLRSGLETTPEQLLEHANAQLAKIKWPAALEILDDLPRNPVGKVDKPGLRDIARRVPASTAPSPTSI
ncbi:class I adenylate-forming enzyme family protein [Corynebacterium terpenotabidum]|uniref:Acyl-CoA synthetase n=1 Tax=Corynebacterium terpenotabidum Y-11 TaxID=1200352 RepID=S4XFH8_9CORY|nr:AMP-binding protein [Corynebacterium terpenotabidum]AGP31334.1 acyl-CoA synthetase [Corynebacterium terpenotabidum Y-11]